LYSCSDPDLSNFVTKEELEELEKLSAPMISVTYNELKTLRDNSQLILGQQYRITDYVTTTSQADTQSAGHPFDVIVTADDESTLNEVARAGLPTFNIDNYKDAYSPTWSEKMSYIGLYQYEGKEYHLYESASQDMQMLVDFKTITFDVNGTSNNDQKEVYPFAFRPTFAKSDEDWDTGENFGEIIAFKYNPGINYFADSDLNAWKIWYSLDNDTSRFAWADAENGKGVIYRMIDEFGNDCPYDFKNVMFERRLIEGRLDEDDGEVTYCYTFNAYNNDSGEMEDASIISFKQIFGRPGGDYNRCYGNIIKEHKLEQESKTIILNDIVFLNILDKVNEDLYFHCCSNTFGDDCYSNTFGNKCKNNSFGNGCYDNHFGDYCRNNIFGNNCHSNQFFSYCEFNTFGNGCNDNSFGNYCRSNSFGNYFRYNSFGNDCYDNSFGNGCNNNNFDDSCCYNTFENDCYDNTLRAYCYNNSFGNGCGENYFYDSCSNNTFGNDCYSNSFENNCYNNSFGNECTTTNFGNHCKNNSFGNGCYNNTFDDSCSCNSFGNNCYFNTFGIYCSFNSFGNKCGYNSFRSSASKTASLKNYCQYNHFDDGCSCNVIWNSSTTSSSNNLQNININRGVYGTESKYNFINIDNINSEKEINVINYNGHIYIDYGDIFRVTYSELVDLIDNSQLIPGRQYRITDYVTTTSQENTQSAGHPFDIIVTAIDDSTLSEEAQVAQNHNDDNGYFDDSNLSAWKIWYSLDSDTARFAWAGNEKIGTDEIEVTTYDSSECTIKSELINGNTFITPFNFESCVWVDANGDNIGYGNNHDFEEMIYEWGYFTDENDNIQLCLYKSDAGLYEEEGQPDYGDKYLYRGVVNVDGTDYDYWQKWDENGDSGGDGLDVRGSGDYVFATTPRIVSNPDSYLCETTTETIETVIPLEPKGVIYRMIDEFGNDCPYDFKNIQFKHPNDATTYLDYYYTFSTVIDGTVTDHSMRQGLCYGNTMKEYISSGKQTLNNNVFINSISSSCYYNSFENDCNHNSFRPGSYYNYFGKSCHHNSFDGNCDSNLFGNNCFYNSFGYSCYYNSFGKYCRYNSFGSYCHNNLFGNDCYHNSFGDRCDYNSFGNSCYYNSFRVDANRTASLKNYVQYNHFDDDCSYNVIWNSDTTSSSVSLKNINVNRGVSGTLISLNIINITTLNQDYEIQVAKNSKGEIKIYCEADLIA
jgi:hypothetical protein